jgi:hypothetical protein
LRDYFKFSHSSNWKYWRGYYKIPEELYYWLKYSVQRAFRGYADSDVWSVDNYLCEIMPSMIRQLKRITHGYPSHLNSPEEWEAILDKIIFGFEAGKRLMDSENWAVNEGSKMITSPVKGKPYLEEISFTNPWSKEQIEHFKNLDRTDSEVFDEGMKLFHKHFFSLWD